MPTRSWCHRDVVMHCAMTLQDGSFMTDKTRSEHNESVIPYLPTFEQKSLYVVQGQADLQKQVSLQTVLEDLSVLHDDDEVPCRIFDQLDVGNRVAVDEQEVSECALLDHAELAGIRIALTGQRQ